MNYLLSILSYLILVKSSAEFKPKEFHFFCSDFVSFHINNNGVEEELLDRSTEDIIRNYKQIEIVYTESKTSQIIITYDGSEKTCIRIRDENGTCDVIGSIFLYKSITKISIHLQRDYFYY